ncbi:MAG: hypothetical protein ACRDWS_14725 [Acidimicrobiia bacterium]
MFLTNDPGGTRSEYVARLAGLGVTTNEAEIVTSRSALASFIRENERAGARVFVIGLIFAQDRAGPSGARAGRR